MVDQAGIEGVMSTPRVVAIIPARLESTRLPRKALADIAAERARLEAEKKAADAKMKFIK